MNLFGNKILGLHTGAGDALEKWQTVTKRLGCEFEYFGEQACIPYIPLRLRTFKWYGSVGERALIAKIKSFKPDFILVNYGNSAAQRATLKRMQKLFNVGILFSEVGWLTPSSQNYEKRRAIYFDNYGTHENVSFAKFNAQQFLAGLPNLTNESINSAIEDSKSNDKKLKSGYVLVILQLDSNIQADLNGHRFNNNQSLCKYIINQVPAGSEIIIRPHPKDANYKQLSDEYNIKGSKVKVDNQTSLDSALEGAKAVIGINSAVLLQALAYDVNIYTLGLSEFSNKGVIIDCSKTDLHKAWTETLYGSRSLRDMIIEGFKNRQIDIDALTTMSDQEIENSFALKPLRQKQTSIFRIDEFV